MIVRDSMTPHPVTLRVDSDSNQALRLMQEHGFHHLPVLGPDGCLAGIVAERDLLLAALNFAGGSVELGAVMHRDVVSVRDDMPLTHAASLMARRAIGGLPVVDAGQRVIGVITETDIFRVFVTMLESKTARAGDGAVREAAVHPLVPGDGVAKGGGAPNTGAARPTKPASPPKAGARTSRA